MRTELIAFAFGLVVGAAGALSGSLWYRNEPFTGAHREFHVEQERERVAQEHERLCMNLALSGGPLAKSLPSECSAVVEKLHAIAGARTDANSVK
ncbi:hypothetical protein [Burkholderia multivorans]|uniref:hypothetical protein n=1 Tax=Burkholderia multivorans TaxID=87883 RepID=UPI000AF7EE45|nr:hypothetical protein [Burkholderia multivorans]HDR9474392.1 hypothetical protein [Burkholderia multivorans]HDR9480234.1 hypothetical protein [Burkholderia multivorans]